MKAIVAFDPPSGTKLSDVLIACSMDLPIIKNWKAPTPGFHVHLLKSGEYLVQLFHSQTREKHSAISDLQAYIDESTAMVDSQKISILFTVDDLAVGESKMAELYKSINTPFAQIYTGAGVSP